MTKKFFKLSLISTALFITSQVVIAEEIQLAPIDVIGSVSKTGKVEYLSPGSTETLDQAKMSEKGYQQVDQIGRYEAGILSQPFGGDIDTHDWIKIRGFNPTIRLDGTTLYDFGFYHWQPNLYGLETIEIVKGADSLTYGSANAGGLINLISKRPNKEKVGQGEVKLTLGNRHERGIATDYTGTISETVHYRIVADYLRHNGEPKGSYSDAYYLAPSLSWNISQNTNFTLLASIQHDDGIPSSGFFPKYDILKRGGFSSRTNFAQNVDEYFRRNQYSIGYELRHQVSDGLIFSSNYRYAYSNKDQFSASLGWDGTSLSTMLIRGKTFTHTIDNHLSQTWKFNEIENTLLGGFDYSHSKNTASNGYGKVALNNLYGNYPTAAAPFSALTPYINKDRQLGLYLQNHFSFQNKLLINLGVRRDFAKGDYRSASQNKPYDVAQNTYAAGIMYITENGLAPYYNYSESFKPLPSTNVNGTFVRYKPYEGEQHEFGLKYLPQFIEGKLSLAYFNLKEKNALITNTVNGHSISTQAGKQTSKGIELQADINLTENLATLVSYTYTKSKTHADKITRTALIPKHSYSAYLNYRFTGNALSGLQLGTGIRYTGTSTNGMSDEKIPAYTLVDITAKYDFSPHWGAQLNISNLLNKKYVSACDSYWCYMGEGRRITGNISYKF
ncbi:TonB-dependent siderophore receptor [Avibacterium sp. 20-15]|uniref:TonB-dependent siderophore receptor n=1 Tax=unclassified Avibacterium TaxID=2685287 RepID=UPI002026855E|nr:MULTISPECIES: TonB-dependent siderophore receptor [unclassified Avibacterium]MCW9732222.1 TonB-dependent siderophore receptor [Avibacterium sp. 20-15]URL02667.1 TonB-dependent siderophore receptor [Avibacterium sp. 20-126]URL04393.1 TonB-dependent siderophore receptor [Avibacterium sp. 20-132]URL07323.1 TonB-dependent siderophore receptor [Avibacterium sp. 21-595]